MPDDTDRPLELYTDCELINELATRCKGIVVGMVKDRTDRSEEFRLDWRGSLCLAIGIAERAGAKLILESLNSGTID